MAACGTLAVAIPYLLTQMVGAGALVQALFGISYPYAVLLVGLLMTLYVSFGGMIATTWVQIVKAVLLLVGGSILGIGVMYLFKFDFGVLAGKKILDRHLDTAPGGGRDAGLIAGFHSVPDLLGDCADALRLHANDQRCKMILDDRDQGPRRAAMDPAFAHAEAAGTVFHYPTDNDVTVLYLA